MEEKEIIEILERYKYDCDGSKIKDIVDEALISFINFAKLQSKREIENFYRIYALMYFAIIDLQQQNKELQDRMQQINSILKDYADTSVPSGLSQCTIYLTIEEINKLYDLSILDKKGE